MDSVASARGIELEIAGVAAQASLWADLAPNTVAALLESLPLDADLQHCRWSGDACWIALSSGPVLRVAGLEAAVTSMYPGTIAVRPPNRRSAMAELLIAYGDAEYRWPPDGVYVTPVGELQGDTRAFRELMASTAVDGKKRITLKASGMVG